MIHKTLSSLVQHPAFSIKNALPCFRRIPRILILRALIALRTTTTLSTLPCSRPFHLRLSPFRFLLLSLLHPARLLSRHRPVSMPVFPLRWVSSLLLRCKKTTAIALPCLHTDSTDTPPQAPSRLRLRPTQTSSIGRGRRSSKLLSRRFGSAREPGGACGIWCTLLVPWWDLSICCLCGELSVGWNQGMCFGGW